MIPNLFVPPELRTVPKFEGCQCRELESSEEWHLIRRCGKSTEGSIEASCRFSASFYLDCFPPCCKILCYGY